jgi:hypothetical protein
MTADLAGKRTTFEEEEWLPGLYELRTLRFEFSTRFGRKKGLALE